MRLAIMTAVLILSAAATYGQHKVPGWKPLDPPAHYEKQKNPAKPNNVAAKGVGQHQAARDKKKGLPS